MGGFKPYFRPNQNWVCGRAAEGKPCSLGPTKNGTCPGTGDCNPCQPVRSLRAQRGLFTLAAVVMAFGVIFYQFGKKEANSSFISPGDLVSAHSFSNNTCTNCHENAHGSLAAGFFSGGRQLASAQKCQSCHNMGENALHPHSGSEAELKSLGAEKPSTIPSHLKSMECATCHKEHHGKNMDLKKITNSQCNACHGEKIHDFLSGHPDFHGYPFKRKTRLIFDHASHFNKHIPQAQGEKYSCQTCHQPDTQGKGMVVRGFQESCASCHGNQTNGIDQTNKGLVLFRIPAIDIKTLQQKGIGVGQWPKDADGAMTPWQKFILSGRKGVKEALEKTKDVDWMDLTKVNAEEMEAVRFLAWEIKTFINEMALGDADDYSGILESAMGEKPEFSKMTSLMQGLPVEVWRGMIRRWVPNLVQEMKAKKAGQKSATSVYPVVVQEDDENRMKAGGWYLKDEDLTLRYRPKGHADSFLKSWMDVSVSGPEDDSVRGKLFAAITNTETSPGFCTQCHSVEKTGDKFKMNWKGKGDFHSEFGLSNFSHNKHFSSVGAEGCMTCHTLNSKSDYDKFTKDPDPTKYESNFLSIKKESCVACHNRTAGKDGCTTCHLYHGEPSSLNARSLVKQHWLTDSPEGKGEEKSSEKAPAKTEEKPATKTELKPAEAKSEERKDVKAFGEAHFFAFPMKTPI